MLDRPVNEVEEMARDLSSQDGMEFIEIPADIRRAVSEINVGLITPIQALMHTSRQAGGGLGAPHPTRGAPHCFRRPNKCK